MSDKIKRTHVLLYKKELEKLQSLCEQTGMNASEVIRLLINSAGSITVSVK